VHQPGNRLKPTFGQQRNDKSERMLPVIGEYLVLDRTTAAVLAFVLNYAAYFAEIFSVPLIT
jgi:ABC-type amino acid transport system permease subunit